MIRPIEIVLQERAVASLNPEQQEAVDYDSGPLLLLAGAGSGKTRVITQRIVHLIERGVCPSSILAVTFTNRAAKEMCERIEKSAPGDSRFQLTVCTFHALGVRILREYASSFHRRSDFVIYDSDDQKSLIKRLLKADGQSATAAELKEIVRQVGQWKATKAFGDAEPLPIGSKYESALRTSNAFDFDDLILKTFQLLSQDAVIRARFRAKWSHVCVDEFQDTNDAQYALIRCLCPLGSDLLVVGDDDQSIYGWRGAEVGNILSFSKDYPSAKTIRLERNYRSTSGILNVANRVIANNQTRLGKELWTERVDDDSVVTVDHSTQRDEAEFVAKELLSRKRISDLTWRDFAVLVRANHLSLDFETMFRSYQIPYRIVRGRSFYERSEIRDALALLRVTINPYDSNALTRLLSRYVKGVGEKSIALFETSARASDRSVWEILSDSETRASVRGAGRAALASFFDSVQRAQLAAQSSNADHFESWQLCLKQLGIVDEGRLELRDEQERQKSENVLRLLTEVRSWLEDNEGLLLSDYLEQAALVSDADALDSDQNAVNIMTVHASKGLEFPVVFVVALEEDVFPHSRAKMEGDIEEERRLFYVAATRAMDRLYLSRSRMRRTFAEMTYQRPSRFLAEVGASSQQVALEVTPSYSYESSNANLEWYDEQPNHESFQVGQSVWHGQYGKGTVGGISRGKACVITVSFPGIGKKKILSDFLSPYGMESEDHW